MKPNLKCLKCSINSINKNTPLHTALDYMNFCYVVLKLTTHMLLSCVVFDCSKNIFGKHQDENNEHIFH